MPSPAAARLLRAFAPLSLLAAPLVGHAQRVTPSDARADRDAPVPPWERRSEAHFTVGGSALFQTARGSDADRVRDGAGFDVYGGVNVSALALNVGYQRADQRLPGAGTGRLRYDGVFIEPRLAIAPYGNFTPYLAGRVAFLDAKVPASARYTASSDRATAYGGGGGLLIALAPSIQLDLGAMYTHVDDRSGGATIASVPGPFTGGGGSGATLRAGLVLGFDRWGR